MTTRRLLLQWMLLAALVNAVPASVYARDGGDSDGHGGDDNGGDDNGGDDNGGDDNGGDDNGGDDNGGDDKGGDDDGGDDDGGKDNGRYGLDQNDALAAKERGAIIPLKSALEIVSHKHHGKVIDVKLTRTFNRPYYQVKIRSTEGVIRTVRLDARTGRFVSFLGF